MNAFCARIVLTLIASLTFLPSARAERLSSGTFAQRVSHLDPADQRKFNQRYFIDSSFAKGKNAPVLYRICHEGVCGFRDIGTQPLKDWAAHLGAHLITLEHRYYGESVPFNSLEVSNLRYLSVENALADLADFQDYATSELGLRGKWIAIGTSYSGSLAAWYRLKYPEKVVGAYSSSSPLQAREDFSENDRQTALALNPVCRARVQAAMEALSSETSTPEGFAAIKARFEADQIRNRTDFLQAIADIVGSAVQYGKHEELCRDLEGEGNLLETFTEATMRSYKAAGGEVPMPDPIPDFDKASKQQDPRARAWLYQTCTQFGFFMTAYKDPAESAAPRELDLSHFHGVCKRLYGVEGAIDAEAFNRKYYEPLLDPRTTNMYFTNGTVDPWSTLSISPVNGNATNQNFTYFIIEGAAHADEFRNYSSPALTRAREIFEELARKWLAD